MPTEKDIIDCYRPLFNLMSSKYGLTLLQSEMDEIIEATDRVNESVSELWRIKCDIEGCDLTACCNGMYYRESGYICLCQIHSDKARKSDEPQKIKESALLRESKRGADGTLNLKQL